MIYRKENEMDRKNKYDICIFTMYIMNHGWVSRYSGHSYRSIKYGNVNFEYSHRKKDASNLSYNDLLYTIHNMQRVNNKYKIFPEDKFIDLYNEHRIENPDDYTWVNGDILNPPKKSYDVEDGFLIRYYNELYENDKTEIVPVYMLKCSAVGKTSMIIGYKYEDGNHIFETLNSLYICKNMVDLKYMDQIKELQEYLNSDLRKAIDKTIKEIEDENEKYINGENDGEQEI